MYSTLPSFVLGFHGCDESLVESVIYKNKGLTPSSNDYDWLGHGIYFWESDPKRALSWAKEMKSRPVKGKGKIEKPAVIGAIIDLGYCLNLIESKSLTLLKSTYDSFCVIQKASGQALPVNKKLETSEDLLKRNLDCAVIEFLHTNLREQKKKEYDSVRGVFWEGKDLYPNAGFKEKNHIQVCDRNPNCIKGYFLPRAAADGYAIP
jgi:hypothetical protein